MEFSTLPTFFSGHQCWLIEYPQDSENKTVLVAGGYHSYVIPPAIPKITDVFASTEMYAVSTDAWSDGPALPTVRAAGTAITIRNRHLWIGGRSKDQDLENATAVPTVLEFSPVSGWSETIMTLRNASTSPVIIPYNL